MPITLLFKGTTDAIFIVRQVQEKLLGKQKELWMAFVDLEKAFDSRGVARVSGARGQTSKSAPSAKFYPLK